MRFSKFGTLSIIIGIILVILSYFFLFNGNIVELAIQTVKGLITIAGIVLVIVGILLFII